MEALKKKKSAMLLQKAASGTYSSFESVQSLSRVPWIAARQASLSITNSQSSLKLTSIESVTPSSHLILCRPLLLLPPIPPSMGFLSRKSADLVSREILLMRHTSTFLFLFNNVSGNSLAAPHFYFGGPVQFMVGELKSRKPGVTHPPPKLKIVS